MQKDFKQLLVVFIFCVIMLGGLLATSYNPDAFAIMLAVVLPMGGLILSGVYAYRERRFNWLLPAEILIFMVFPGILMQWMLIAEIGLIPAGAALAVQLLFALFRWNDRRKFSAARKEVVL